jgi:uncharacterized protein YqjF (DUF2071 family)
MRGVLRRCAPQDDDQDQKQKQEQEQEQKQKQEQKQEQKQGVLRDEPAQDDDLLFNVADLLTCWLAGHLTCWLAGHLTCWPADLLTRRFAGVPWLRLMKEILSIAGHRPFPMPPGRWRMRQRWNDLLFAHWPVRADALTGLLPAGLEIDTFDGWAWVGVVPFHMDQVVVRGVGDRTFGVPSAKRFPELNLRTYVRSAETLQAGVYFFSLDAASALAVLGARLFFSLPYFWASMESRREAGDWIHYRSRRVLTTPAAAFSARYRSLGKPAAGPLEEFLTARYCLYTRRGAEIVVGNIHHLPWQLESAEAEFESNELAQAGGITLPNRAPVLHYSRELVVYLWGLEALADRGLAAAPIPA